MAFAGRLVAGCVVGSLAACFVDPGVATSGGGPTSATSEGGSTTGTSTSTGTTGTTVTTVTTSTTEPTTEPGSSGVDPGTTSGVGGTSSGGVTSDSSSGGGSSSGGVELPVPCDTVLYYNDFTEGAGTLVLVGEWKWDQLAGELVTAALPGQYSNAYVPDVAWTDVRAYVSARVEEGTGTATLRVRMNAPSLTSYYYGAIRPSDVNQVRFGRMLNGLASAFTNFPLPVDFGAWSTIALEAVGTSVTIEVEGMSKQANDQSLVQGTVSFGASDDASVRFDWILVCGV